MKIMYTSEGILRTDGWPNINVQVLAANDGVMEFYESISDVLSTS